VGCLDCELKVTVGIGPFLYINRIVHC